MADFLEQLGSRIRTIRRDKGLTIAQLAEAADLSDNFIGFIERGQRSPTIKSLQKIASALEVKLEDIFHISYQDTPEKEQIINELIYQIKDKDIHYIRLAANIIKDVFEATYQLEDKKPRVRDKKINNERSNRI